MKLTQGTGLKFLVCLALLLNSCEFSKEQGKPSLQKVRTLGKLTVGKLLPVPTQSTWETGAKSSKGKYLIHLLHPSLPPLCIDEECGVSLNLGKPQKVQLYGASDLKLADIGFGIFSTVTNEEFSEQSKNYGVLVISNQKGEILSIFEHVELSDVNDVVRRQNL